ncbi:MAG: hypothetical protein CMH41_10680 [Micrococcales bacterium]|nr:hypothetical protein [Micrococcales bacterium]
MLNLLRNPRWQAFTAAALIAIISFGLLSMWQYNRAEEERIEFSAIAERLDSSPAALSYSDDSDAVNWQRVQVTGEYDSDAQLLIRNRPQSGSNGFWVATLLRTDEGATWVVRGWIPAAIGNREPAPTAPAGVITVDGYARTPDNAPARKADDVPIGQASAMNPAGLSEIVAGPQPSAWYVIAANDSSLTPVPLPEATDSRNLSYAGQWLLFAAVVIGGWFFFLRREAAETSEEMNRANSAASV